MKKDSKKLLFFFLGAPSDSEESGFVRRAVVFSAIAAVLITVNAAVFIAFRSDISPSLADLFNSVGFHDIALKITESVPTTEGSDALRNIRFDIACSLLEDERFDDAAALFESLGKYKDSREKLFDCKFASAMKIFKSGDYERASSAFFELGNDSKSTEMFNRSRYMLAQKTAEGGDTLEAIRIYSEIRTFEDSYEKAIELALGIASDKAVAEAIVDSDGCTVEQIEKISDISQKRSKLCEGRLAVGWYHTVGLKNDGTAVACGLDKNGQCKVDDWTDIVAVAAGAYHTIGLKSDGTVIACGDNSCGQCNVSEWKNVVAIATGYYDTVALLSDGTAIACGYHSYDIHGWHDISKIAAGAYMAAGIYGSGRVASTHPSTAPDASEIYCDIAVSTACWAAVTADGRLLSNIPALPDWGEVLSVSVSSTGVMAITGSGELRTHFFRDCDAVAFDKNSNIATVCAGSTHYALMTKDGKVFASGNNSYGQCDTEDWDLC